METREISRIVRVLRAAYPDKNIRPETVEVYIRCLSDLPVAALEGAVLAHISENKWFPTVAELREAALQLLPGGQLPTALEAWAEVTKQVELVGWYGQPTFSHPVIEQAVKALGWNRICESENVVAERAHFLRLYETYCGRVKEQLVQLPEVQRIRDRLTEDVTLHGKLRSLAEAKRLRGGESISVGDERR